MADVTNEPIYEILKHLQQDVAAVKATNQEIKSELQSLRGRTVAMQNDIHNIYSVLDRHDARLERIERRLEPTDTVG